MQFADLSTHGQSQNLRRILLVDENEHDFVRIQTMLSEARENRYMLEWASSFQAAKDAQTTEILDAILLDDDFDPSAGVDLIREALSTPYLPPVIRLFSRDLPQADIEARNNVVADYLFKDQLCPALLERSIHYAIERRRLETELERRRREHLDILESIQDGLFAIDRDWRIKYINQRAAQNVGYKVEELLGKNMLDTFPKIRNTQLEANYHKAMIERIPMQFETHGIYKKQWYSISVYPTSDGILIYWQDITERKTAEEALRLSDVRFNKAFMAAPNALVISRLHDGLIQDINDAFEKLFGFRRDEVIGKTSLELNLFANPSDRERAILKLQANSSIRDYEIAIRTRSGETRQVSLSVETITIDDESFILTILKDITDRKQAEVALREAHDRAVWLARFPDENPNPVARVAADGTVLYCNQATIVLPGWSCSVGRTIIDPLLALVNQAAVTGNQVDQDVYLDDRIYSFTAVPFLAEQYVNLYGRDVTDRRQAEEALRESVRREKDRANELETLMDAVPVMIWISRDPECRVIIGNRAGYEFLRMSSGENLSVSAPDAALKNQHYTNMKDGHPIPPSEMPMQVAAATGIPTRDFLYDLVFDDGRIYQLIGNVNPLFDTNGIPCGAVGAFVDITELTKLQNDQLEYRTQMEIHHRLMEQREKDRQSIARDIHDGPVQTLSSTLFNIQIAAQMISELEVRVELEHIGRNIKNAVQELRQVIYELRPPAVIRFGLARAIKFHADELRERNPNIKLTLWLADNQEQISELLDLTLFRIYQEAVTNIIRHAEATQIWVNFSLTKTNLVLEIRDNGQGFLFEQKLSQFTEKGHYGLAGIKERVEAIGGTLVVESKPGKGTSIKVTAPKPMDY